MNLALPESWFPRSRLLTISIHSISLEVCKVHIAPLCVLLLTEHEFIISDSSVLLVLSTRANLA